MATISLYIAGLRAGICQKRKGKMKPDRRAGLAASARRTQKKADSRTAATKLQCECALPVPHNPQDFGCPVQTGAASFPAVLDAKTDNFFLSFAEPQFGHLVPCHSVVRARISLSWLHLSQ